MIKKYIMVPFEIVIVILVYPSAFAIWIGIATSLYMFWKLPDLSGEVGSIERWLLNVGQIGMLIPIIWASATAYNALSRKMHQFFIDKGWHDESVCQYVKSNESSH